MPVAKKFPALIPLLAVMGLTLALFALSLTNGFVNWDDDYNFLKNPGFRLHFADSFRWAWNPDLVGNFHPLSWHLLWLQARVLGFSPQVFHAVSWALHAANVGLLFILLRRLVISPGANPVNALAAATGAIWFAVHPLRVEMVSWASCQPHLWSVFFALLAAYAFLNKRRRFTALFFVAAVLCKGIVITLPLLLLALPDRKVANWRSWRQIKVAKFQRGELVLWATAFLGGVIALYSRDLSHAVAVPANSEELVIRLLNPLVVFAQSISQSLWPQKLSPLYPLLKLKDTLLCSVFSVSVISFWFLDSRTRPLLRFSFWAFLALLLPQALSAATETLSFADRYTYLASIPLAALVTWAVQNVLASTNRAREKNAGLALASAVVVFLAVQTPAQIKRWGDSETLWASAVANPDNPNAKALYNMGTALMNKGRFAEAEQYLHRSLSIDRRNALALNSLGVCEMVKGHYEVAQHFLLDSIKLKPNFAEAMSNLAHAQSVGGELGTALRWVDHAVAISPNDVRFRENRARILHKLGRFEESMREWRWLVKSLPNDPVPKQQLSAVQQESLKP